jgi:transposase
MITIGVDAHKRLHVALALDDAGQELSEWRGPNDPTSWESIRSWAAGLGSERQWGIEGAWNYGRGLAQHLVAAGEVVFDINPRWTAVRRRSARRPGKTDKLDATVVAHLVRQEATTLPRVLPEDETALLDLLTTEREGALGEASRLRNQIHALILQIDATYELHMPALKSSAGLNALQTYEAPDSRPLQQERAAAVRRLANRLQLALAQADELEERIKQLAKASFSP